jgi:ferredoxin
MFKIEIDRSLCSGFGSCVELAPAVIALDEDGLASFRVGSMGDPVVLEAAAGCPMAAITAVEEEAA